MPRKQTKKPILFGRELSTQELELIRTQVETGFDSIGYINPDIRDLIERQWPDLAKKLPRAKPRRR